MKSSVKVWIIIMAAASTLLSTIACDIELPSARTGELQTISEAVQVADADSVNVMIFIPAGELVVGGGASDLLEAEFVFNVAEIEPEIDFRNGTLRVTSPDVDLGPGSMFNLGNFRNEWDLFFNDDVPMDMTIDMGAGLSDLDLGTLSLTSLDISAGAGDVELDLSDSSFLSRLEVDAGVGELTVDLSGEWQNDLDASIMAGVGNFSLLLPRSVCVRVEVDSGIANVNASGFSVDGDVYSNDACGESNVTMRIDIDAGVGSINLRLGD
jgi:hypothetical protein